MVQFGDPTINLPYKGQPWDRNYQAPTPQKIDPIPSPFESFVKMEELDIARDKSALMSELNAAKAEKARAEADLKAAEAKIKEAEAKLAGEKGVAGLSEAKAAGQRSVAEIRAKNKGGGGGGGRGGAPITINIPPRPGK